MNAKISTTFLLKIAKINSKGLIPIYLRITVDVDVLKFQQINTLKK